MSIVELQSAKVSGARVITTLSPHNAKNLCSTGTDPVLDYSSATPIQETKGLMEG